MRTNWWSGPAPLGDPGGSWDRLGALLFSSCRLGSLFDSLMLLFGPFWGALGPVLGRLGLSWSSFGVLWEPFWSLQLICYLLFLLSVVC